MSAFDEKSGFGIWWSIMCDDVYQHWRLLLACVQTVESLFAKTKTNYLKPHARRGTTTTIHTNALAHSCLVHDLHHTESSAPLCVFICMGNVQPAGTTTTLLNSTQIGLWPTLWCIWPNAATQHSHTRHSTQDGWGGFCLPASLCWLAGWLGLGPSTKTTTSHLRHAGQTQQRRLAISFWIGLWTTDSNLRTRVPSDDMYTKAYVCFSKRRRRHDETTTTTKTAALSLVGLDWIANEPRSPTHGVGFIAAGTSGVVGRGQSLFVRLRVFFVSVYACFWSSPNNIIIWEEAGGIILPSSMPRLWRQRADLITPLSSLFLISYFMSTL